MSNHLSMENGNQRVMNKNNKCVMGKTFKNITAVLSTYNEEMSIGSTILLTKLYVDRVIVVDDASSDRTAEIAQKAGAEVIINKTKVGKGPALETGFKAAVHVGADIIVTMDSKGRHNPVDIPILVAPIIKGSADMVNGSLYLNGLGGNIPIYRRVSKTIMGKFTSVNMDKITKSHNGFCAFAASTAGIFRFDAQGMAVENDLFSGAKKFDLRIKEVEIRDLHDFDSPVKFIPRFLKTVVKDVEVNKPLYIYSVPGFALATCGFYMGLRFLEAFLLGIESLHFWSVFLMIFLCLAGVYMTVRGIVIHSMVDGTMQN